MQEPVVAPHDRDQLGFGRGLRLALALVVGDRVVDRRHGDVELALDGVAELKVGARCRRQVHGDAVLLEKALLLRCPDRPIAAAGKHDDLERLCGLRLRLRPARRERSHDYYGPSDTLHILHPFSSVHAIPLAPHGPL